VDGGGLAGPNKPAPTCDIGAVEFYPNVDIALDFDPILSSRQTTTDATGCPAGFSGIYRFNALMKGEAANVPPLSDLYVQVAELTNGNLLRNAIGGPGGVGATLNVGLIDDYADGILQKTESVRVPFSICLKSFSRFRFFVDVYGAVNETDNIENNN
jgi:hypothetical protein